MILKNAILKSGIIIGIEGRKQVRDQRNNAQVYLKMHINPNGFAILILTAIPLAK